jgi:hypothetical protein
MFTTLNAIRECLPCSGGYTRLCRYLGKTEADNELISFATIAQSNNIQDAIWCYRTTKTDWSKKLWVINRAVSRVKHIKNNYTTNVATAYATAYAYAAYVAAAAAADAAAGVAADAAATTTAIGVAVTAEREKQKQDLIYICSHNIPADINFVIPE